MGRIDCEWGRSAGKVGIGSKKAKTEKPRDSSIILLLRNKGLGENKRNREESRKQYFQGSRNSKK